MARILAGLLLFDERLIIVSAHRQDTAREVFHRLVGLIENNPSLNERVEAIAKSEMREFIRMRSGQEVRFKARTLNAGRGMAAECLLLDEAQILPAASWSAILPTMSAQRNPQVWLLGTPPTEHDDGEVFRRIRQAGIDGDSDRLAYLEWSAARDDDLDAPQTWARANPAYGIRISREAIEAERAVMADDQFRRERLGMWEAGSRQWAIPQEFWENVGDLQSVAVDRIAIGVEVAPDLAWTSVALAGRRVDGAWHVELLERKDGWRWVPAFVQDMLEANAGKVRALVADAGSPTKTIFPDFARLRLQPTPPRVADVGIACTRLLDGVVTGSVRHTRQGQMDAAVAAAGRRALGDTGMWVWSRKSAASDITPVQAATLALFGAQNDQVLRPVRGTGERRKIRRRAVIRS